jgi:hypothetical protein
VQQGIAHSRVALGQVTYAKAFEDVQDFDAVLDIVLADREDGAAKRRENNAVIDVSLAQVSFIAQLARHS